MGVQRFRAHASQPPLGIAAHQPALLAFDFKYRAAIDLILADHAAHAGYAFQLLLHARRLQISVPAANFNADQTVASMQKIADLQKKDNAQLWINHDKAQRDTLKMAPAFYE